MLLFPLRMSSQITWRSPLSSTAIRGFVADAPESSTRTLGSKAGVDATAPFGPTSTHEARAAKASTAATKRGHARHEAEWLEPTTLPRLRTAGPLLTHIGGSLDRPGAPGLRPHEVRPNLHLVAEAVHRHAEGTADELPELEDVRPRIGVEGDVRLRHLPERNGDHREDPIPVRLGGGPPLQDEPVVLRIEQVPALPQHQL